MGGVVGFVVGARAGDEDAWDGSVEEATDTMAVGSFVRVPIGGEDVWD